MLNASRPHLIGSVLLEDYGHALDGEGKKHLHRVVAGAHRMSEIIDTLLSLARLTRTELRHESVDMSKICRDVVAQLRANEPTPGVDFVAAESVSERGDPQLLRALFENLLGNAWKFTSKRPDARIEFGRENVKGESIFFIRDNGAGFNMAMADQLFAPFRRLHTTSEFEGTGIGLATVQRIARRHGGRAWAEGAENQGATIRFTLSGHVTGQRYRSASIRK